MMEQKDNNLLLFRNLDKVEGDNRPDLKGFGMVNGVEMEVAAWLKESPRAGKFYSITVKPKMKEKEEDDLPL